MKTAQVLMALDRTNRLPLGSGVFFGEALISFYGNEAASIISKEGEFENSSYYLEIRPIFFNAAVMAAMPSPDVRVLRPDLDVWYFKF